MQVSFLDTSAVLMPYSFHLMLTVVACLRPPQQCKQKKTTTASRLVSIAATV